MRIYGALVTQSSWELARMSEECPNPFNSKRTQSSYQGLECLHYRQGLLLYRNTSPICLELWGCLWKWSPRLGDQPLLLSCWVLFLGIDKYFYPAQSDFCHLHCQFLDLASTSHYPNNLSHSKPSQDYSFSSAETCWHETFHDIFKAKTYTSLTAVSDTFQASSSLHPFVHIVLPTQHNRRGSGWTVG